MQSMTQYMPKTYDRNLIELDFSRVKQIIHGDLAVDNAMMFSLTKSECRYKSMNKRFLILGFQIKQPHTVTQFLLIFC